MPGRGRTGVREKTEVRGQRSEVRKGQRSGRDRGQRSEVGGQRTEGGGP